jgi:hypothetical protein
MRVSLRNTARAAAVASLPLVFMAAQPVVDGLTYEFVMKSTVKGKESVTMRGRGSYAGDDARIEILEAGAQSGGQDMYGGKGGYFIVKGGGKEMLLVSPKDKTYMKWDLAAMMAGMGAAVNAVGGLVKMDMSDITIDAKEIGPGPTIQGYATRHFRLTQNYTMTAKVFGRSSKTRSESTTDYYVAPSVRIANPFVSTEQANAMMAQFDMFNKPEYKNQMAAANAKMPKTGAPLRWVTTTVSTDEKGKAETSITSMEMTNIKSGNIPASEFQIPAGYSMVEMPNMATANDGQGNAVAADSAGSAKAPSAKDAAAKKLKGIFGGKKN